MSKSLKTVLQQFIIKKPKTIQEINGGLINESFFVITENEKYVLQKLHSIFLPEVMKDINAVTNHIKKNNMVTPQLIKTKNGDLFLETKEELWRMMTFIEGRSFEFLPDPIYAKFAGKLVGKFHMTVASLDHSFCNRFENWHNTHFYLENLENIFRQYENSKKGSHLKTLVNKILLSAQSLQFSQLPRKIVHGDLKISNIRFNEKSTDAVCLLDLDTFGEYPLVLELGDAVRSWCNLHHEGDLNSSFSKKTFRFMMEGYIPEARNYITKEELLYVPRAAQRIALELSSRFVIDAFEENRFKLEKARYENLYDQNIKKAKAQYLLFEDLLCSEKEMIKIINSLVS